MAEIEGLGKASLDLEANLARFEANVKAAEKSSSGLGGTLDSLAAIANIAERELNKVKLGAGNVAESRASARSILDGVRGLSREALDAADNLDKVKLNEKNAAESKLAAEGISAGLNQVSRNADQAKRKLTEVKLAGGRTGVGVGIIGSGYGRIGALGAAIGLGALTAPAAGPAAAGLLAAVPALATGAAGALGTLILAFQGVGKAIGGDKKAFDELVPAQQQFVQQVRSLDGWLRTLKQTAGSNLFPGLTDALHSALSPGTLAAITRAVAAFASAIGQAGAAWGRYFGSAEFQQIFGPLMQSGSRNLGVLSDALLHLFDALGVVGRAAIPFTNWLNDAIDKGAKFAAAWLHAKDATGQLGSAMNEAQSSLRLVGSLAAALLKAIGALGQALYPVSKVAVRDLTDGLNALAKIITRNQQEIRDIVGGALAALVSAVKVAYPIVARLAEALTAVVKAMGGWKTAFEIVIGGVLITKLQAVVTGVALIGTTAEAAASAQGGVGALRLALLALGSPEVLAAIAVATAALYTMNRSAGGVGSKPVGTPAADQTAATGGEITQGKGGQWYWHRAGRYYPISAKQAATMLAQQAGIPSAEVTSEHGGGQGAGTGAMPSVTKYSPLQINQLLRSAGASPEVAANLTGIAMAESGGRLGVLNNTPATGDYSIGLFQENFYKALGPSRVARYAPMFGMSPNTPVARFVSWLGQHPAAQAQIALDLYSSSGYSPWQGDAYVKAHPELLSGGGSPFGTPPPFTTNLGPKPPKPPKPPVIPLAVTNLLNRASVNASQAKQLGNVGGTARRYLENELADLKAAQAQIAKLTPTTAAEKQQVAAKATEIANKIRDVQTLIKKSAFVTGDALLPARLKSMLASQDAKFKADSTFAQVLTGQAAEKFATTLQGDITSKRDTLEKMVATLKTKLAGATGKQKTAIQDELGKINTQLADVQQQVVQTLQGKVQTLQQHVQTYMQAVQGQLDQQFEAATQQMVDQAAATYYQNGAKTPLEQQLADMQAADQLKQLQDAVTAAQTPEEKAAAQRALDEYNLEIRATAERAQVDRDYAAKVKQIQADRSAAEAEMNAKLAKLGDAFANGTGTIGDLTAIAAAYGLQIDTTTIPDFVNLSTAVGDLHDAMQALADYIGGLTGSTPSVPGGYTRQPTTASLTAAVIGTSVTATMRDLIAGGADAATAAYLAKGLSIPLLDDGGTVMQTGVAVVHRGEWFSGVGDARGAPITIQTGPIYGAIDRQTALRWASTLKPALERVVTVSK